VLNFSGRAERIVGVQAARAIVGRVRSKKEIFICGLKNNPYLCGSIITFIKVSELYVSR